MEKFGSREAVNVYAHHEGTCRVAVSVARVAGATLFEYRQFLVVYRKIQPLAMIAS